MHTPRAVLLQTLGHFVLGHSAPADFADFLRQRVEANYFAAAVLVPEQAAVAFLRHAKENRNLSVEDMRDVFSVSYEMAAHRFTNLATFHLGLTCHFVKNDASGIIYKAYENDGVVFPADAAGAIEGQRMCRHVVGTAGLRVGRPVQPALPVLRHAVRHLLVRRLGRPRQRARVRDHPRRAVRRRAVVPRPGHDQAHADPPVPTRPAASGRQPGWRPAGTEWPGRPRARTRTSCSRCRPAASPALTRPTCTRSSTGTSKTNPAGSGPPRTRRLPCRRWVRRTWAGASRAGRRRPRRGPGP